MTPLIIYEQRTLPPEARCFVLVCSLVRSTSELNIYPLPDSQQKNTFLSNSQ